MDVSWSFDLRTAILFGALVTLLTDGLLLLSWKSLPGAVRPSLRWWLAGLLLHPLGFLLVGLRDVATDWLSIPVAHAVLALALSCKAIALRMFYGLPERRRQLWGITTLVALVAVWFTNVAPSLHWRIISMEFLLAVLTGCSALSIFRRGGPPGMVPRLTGSLFALASVVLLSRAAHEALWPVAVADVINASAMDLTGLAVLALLPVLTTVGFLLMCTQRSQEELERTARIEAVRRMREVMRTEDLVGRLGGEEFVAVMPDIDLDSALAAAERLRRCFCERPMTLTAGAAPVEVTVTVSVGVAALEPSDLMLSHLLRRADRAMYAAKAGGRNNVVVDGRRT